MKSKLYICPLSAQNPRAMITSCSAGLILANSEDEAVGMAIRECHRTFPESRGYHDHKVAAELVEESLLNDAGYRRAPELAWTRDKPTKPGWYWRAEDYSPGSVNCIEVCGRKGFPGLYIDSDAVGHTHSLDDVADDSWWYGPVDAPPPPVTQEKASA